MNFKNLIKLIILLFCSSAYISFAANSSIQPTYLRTEYKENPFIDDNAPRLSWELQAEGFNQYQSAYQILVASSLTNLNRNIGDLWDSKQVHSSETNQIAYAGKPLKSGQKVWWKVKVWNTQKQEGKWSKPSSWEMAKLNATDWQAKWVGTDLNHLAPQGEYHLPPSPYLRKETGINKKIKSARLYISSLGLHNFYINGQKIGNDYFASGWTDYNKRVYYNVYDVTEQLRMGKNAFGAILSDGWYSGYLGYALLVGSKKVNHFYGDFPLLKAQIDIIYENGEKEVIYTDKSWKTSVGGIQESDLLAGETYDANKEPINWNIAGFNDSQWKNVQEFDNKEGQLLQLYPSYPIQVVDELPIKSIKRVGDNKFIIDFGQNFAGNIRMKLKGQKNDSLIFRYGEMLHTDGSLMTENLRRARSTDTYIFKGDSKAEVWSPSFTFHGFQYVEVTGLKEEPSKDFLTGLVMTSALKRVGHFETDNPILNQIYSNIVWTQQANYLDVPTDCPQRDERLGWTGDAQVYMRSAIFNSDVAPFHTKWIKDLNDSQWPSGAYPVYSPMPTDENGIAAIRATDTFSPGWSEAGIICVYEIFKGYNDQRIVKESLPYMLKFMTFLKSRVKDGVLKEGAFDDANPKGGFGDWLSVGEKTSPDLLATIYYFYSAKLMAEMCHAIGEEAHAAVFGADMVSIREGFKKHYMGADGKLKTNSAVYGDGEGYVEGQNGFGGHTQTAYANAIYSGILDGIDAKQAGIYLRELVEVNGNKLTTGFLGFKPLLPALSKTESTDKAYNLILSTEYPSLGYEVINGATSIWERWDSYIKGVGFIHNAAMNSFSHYAFGSVNEWMFENMLGIKAKSNGYKEIFIKPEIGHYGIKSVKGSYHSIAGLIVSEWVIDKNNQHQKIQIPVNVTAYCYVNANSIDEIKINGKALKELNYIRNVQNVDGYVVVELGSGKYNIEVIKP